MEKSGENQSRSNRGNVDFTGFSEEKTDVLVELGVVNGKKQTSINVYKKTMTTITVFESTKE